MQQRLIQAQLLAHFCFDLCRRPAAENGIHRIAGGHTQQQEHQGCDQPQHHRGKG